MMPCGLRAILKCFEVLFCLICFIYKVWTIWEARRVTLYLQKQSREWAWNKFNNTSDPMSLFTDITFGSYVLITSALLIGHLLGDPVTKAEKILLVLGFILMIICGGTLIITVDEVPDKLLANSIILGVFAIITAILLLVDAGMRSSKPTTKAIKIIPKKEEPSNIQASPQQPIVLKNENAEDEIDNPTVEIKSEPSNEIPTRSRENGISSVHIRIKDPHNKTDTEYRQTSGLDESDLSEAERLDGLISEPIIQYRQEPFSYIRGRGRGYLANTKTSPIRHTSSYYVSNENRSPFAWRRMSDKN